MAAPAGKAVSQSTRCLTDKFTISNQYTVPEVCGDLAGEHGELAEKWLAHYKKTFYLYFFLFLVYFEAAADCNSLDFELGVQVVGVTAFGTRSWNIKVTQISCTDPNLPPQGCDQYYTGTTGRFQSFNFGSSNRHLANQHQNICFRWECQCILCYDCLFNICVPGENKTIAWFALLLLQLLTCQREISKQTVPKVPSRWVHHQNAQQSTITIQF